MFSVVIPTIWKSKQFAILLDRYQSCNLVDEIVIIDNQPESCDIDLSQFNKVKRFQQSENIYVNPAWNLGVSLSSNQDIIISNDDILYDVETTLAYIDSLDNFVSIGAHAGSFYGLIEGYEDKNLDPYIHDGHFVCKGWGCLMFVKKDKWIEIPNDLKIYFGDDWIAHKMKPAQSVWVKGGIETRMSTSSSNNDFNTIILNDVKIFEDLVRDGKVYDM